MKISLADLNLGSIVEVQIDHCLCLIQDVLGGDALGVYLYGSAVMGGLQRYSDLDLLIVSSRSTTTDEKSKLVSSLLSISGIYMQDEKPPIELTIVEKSAVNPWQYPPKFDFQYGEWLREEFELGNIEPWSTKEMPDLAVLITQVLLVSCTLAGENPDQLLSPVPYKDFIAATVDALPHLIEEVGSDTRNVLLTLARIWSTVATDSIRSKSAAADWVINRLPEKYHPVLLRAKAICVGEAEEYWDDVYELIKPCADFMLSRSNDNISKIMLPNGLSRSIKIA